MLSNVGSNVGINIKSSTRRMKFDAKKGRNNSVADKVPNKVVKKAMNRSITIWCIFLLR